MKNYVISFLLAGIFTHTCFPQGSNEAVIYFNGLFQPEKETERIQYYGIPKKIKGNLYEMTFFSLDSQKVALGEYSGTNFKKRNGVFLLYNYKDNIILTVNYRKGILHGIYKKFYDNGQLADSVWIEMGYSIGTWKSWHSNGQLKEIKNYELAKGIRGTQYSALSKEFKSYSPDGKLIDSGFYFNNQRSGIWIEWLEGGTLRSVGEYKKGWKKGTWRYYDSKGKLLYLRRFSSFKYDKEGERIEIKKG